MNKGFGSSASSCCPFGRTKLKYKPKINTRGCNLMSQVPFIVFVVVVVVVVVVVFVVQQITLQK